MIFRAFCRDASVVLFAALLTVPACNLAAPPSAAPPSQSPLTASPTTPPLEPPVSDRRSPLWRPAPGATWQVQFAGLPVDRSFEAEVYFIDLFDNDESVVAALHAEGRKAICYLSAGSWEDWRPDAAQFPIEVIGRDYEGWPGEKWLDIRRLDRLGPILQARLDLCAAKGFDGVDPDNVNAYLNDTGFPLTYEDQLVYNKWLAEEAHARGLAIGLKNDTEQAEDLLPYFDWVITEGCFEQGWCDQARPFIRAGKPVFAIEYTDTGIALEDFCDQAVALGFSAILKNRELDAYREDCVSQ